MGRKEGKQRPAAAMAIRKKEDADCLRLRVSRTRAPHRNARILAASFRLRIKMNASYGNHKSRSATNAAASKMTSAIDGGPS